MPVICWTGMHYNKQRPRASSASIWLDRTSPLGRLTLSLQVSQSHSVFLTLTGRVVLMTSPQWWLGAVWDLGKALTSVTVFSAARCKSVTSEKTGTWISVERPVMGKTYIVCSCVCIASTPLTYVWHACRCSDSHHFFGIWHTANVALISKNQ